ncbi:MAG: hypothetical protein ABSG53_01100, partial [Thermoguttaceae bacterium]
MDKNRIWLRLELLVAAALVLAVFLIVQSGRGGKEVTRTEAAHSPATSAPSEKKPISLKQEERPEEPAKHIEQQATAIDKSEAPIPRTELAKIDSSPNSGQGATPPPVGRASPLPTTEDKTKIGRFTSDGQDVLLKFEANDSVWHRVSPDEFLAGRQSLLALPSYRPRVVVLNVGATLELFNGTRIELLPNDVLGQPGIDIEFGRVVIKPLAQAGTRLRVLVGSHAGTITLTNVESIAGLDVTRVHEPGKDPEKILSHALTRFYVARGSAVWEEGKGEQPVRLTAPAELLLDGANADTPSSAGKDIPKWITANTVNELDQRAALSVSQALPADRAASLSLMELTEDRRKEIRWLAARCLGYLGQFDPMTAALNDVDFRREWPDYIDQLKEAIARGPETAAGIRQSLEKQYGNESAGALYRMLWGYTDKDLADGEDDRLVTFLDHEVPVFRVLAFCTLKDITRQSFNYRPEASSATKRQQSVQQWRRQQQLGRIRFNVPEVKPRTAPVEIPPKETTPESSKPPDESEPTDVKPASDTAPIVPGNPSAPGPGAETSLNLTDKVDASRRLVWEVPPGAWTVQVLGPALASYVLIADSIKPPLPTEYPDMELDGFDSPYLGHTGSWDGKGGAMWGASKVPDLDKEVEMGLRWTFMPVHWNEMEPDGPVDLAKTVPPAWQALDTFVIEAQKRKLNILMQAPVVGGNAGGPPDWAGRREPGKSAPKNMEAAAAFAGKLAARYSPGGVLSTKQGWGRRFGIRAWELDNEPESYRTHWQDQAGDYAEFVTKAASQIKRADPRAMILVPATAGGRAIPWIEATLDAQQLKGSPDYRRAAIQNSIGPVADGVSFHLYEGLAVVFHDPDCTVERLLESIRGVFNRWESRAPGFHYAKKREYWHTEGNYDFVGWLSADRRAAWRIQFFTRAFAAGVRKVCVMDASERER